jgi:hypothetical protein
MRWPARSCGRRRAGILLEAATIMKAFASACLVLVMCGQPAVSLNCEDVRYYVETYGAAATLAYAKRMGATPEQIRDGRACLRRASRSEGRPNRTREVVTR